jgi:hypothetical protein
MQFPGMEDTMSRRTAFLSKLIGLFCVLYGLSAFVHRQTTVDAMERFVVLGLGLAMVLGHNLWSGGTLPVVVTIVGWLTLAKGLLLTFLAPAGALAYLSAMHYDQFFYIYAGVALLLGAYLTYGGFAMKGNPSVESGR